MSLPTLIQLPTLAIVSSGLLVNPTFGDGLTGWSVTAGTWTASSEPGVDFARATSVTAFLTQDSDPLTGDDDVKVTVRMREDSGSNTRLAAILKDSGGSVIDTQYLLATSSAFAVFTYTFSAASVPVGGYVTVVCQCYSAPGDFDYVTVEEV